MRQLKGFEVDRHMEQEINVALAEYIRTGVARIQRWKLYAAYDAQRLREGVWRDIKERIIDQGGAWSKANIIETESDVIFVNEDMGSPLRDRI